MLRADTLILEGEGESPFPLLHSQAACKALHIKLRNIRRDTISWLSSTTNLPCYQEYGISQI